MKVGFLYQNKSRWVQMGYKPEVVCILRDEGGGEYNYLCVDKEGHTEWVNKRGESEFLECGGNWVELDLDSAKPAKTKYIFDISDFQEKYPEPELQICRFLKLL